jgi:hypothetical protein
MAAVIRIKRSTGATAPASLKSGELAYSAGTGLYSNGGDRLYYGKGDDGNGNATSVVVIGGEYFGNLADHAPGVLTASSAIIVDGDSKVDAINVDNITIDGNTISSTNTDGNIILDPNGTGVVNVNTSRITNVSDPTSAQDAATKAYVDANLDIQSLSISGDTGTDNIDLSDSDISFLGDSAISTTVTDNTVTFNMALSGVSGDFGSSTSVPVITVDKFGRITAASTQSISTVLNVAADGTSGLLSLLDSSLSIVGGEGINTSVIDNEFTIAAELATKDNAGVASFDSSQFTVTSGNVTSDQFTIGTTNLNLGQSTTTLAGLTQVDVDNVRIFDNTVASSTGVLYIDPNPIDSDGGEVIIRGDLTVQGTTTTVNSTTVSINDKNIVLADSAANAAEADGGGITINGPTTPATILYDGNTDRWDFNKGIDLNDSIGGASLYFNGTQATEAIEDHLVNNLLLAGEGIDLTYDDNANTLTVAGELATLTNAGVAAFGGWADGDSAAASGTRRQFQVSDTGNVWVKELDGGTY